MSVDSENQIKQIYAAIFSGGTSCGTIPPGKPNNSIISKLDYLIERAQAAAVARGFLLAKDNAGVVWAGDGAMRWPLHPSAVWPWGGSTASSKNADAFVPGATVIDPAAPGVEVLGPFDEATLDGMLGLNRADFVAPTGSGTGAVGAHEHAGGSSGPVVEG